MQVIWVVMVTLVLALSAGSWRWRWSPMLPTGPSAGDSKVNHQPRRSQRVCAAGHGLSTPSGDQWWLANPGGSRAEGRRDPGEGGAWATPDPAGLCTLTPE